MSRKRWVILMSALAAVGALVGSLLRPGVGSIDASTPTEGDAALAAAAMELVPDAGVYALTVAEVTPEGSRISTVGAPLDSTFEIGSITKGLTGVLLADAIDRGDVSAETALGEVYDLGEHDAEHITVDELAQHRSGLPRLATGLLDLPGLLVSQVLARNPYDAAPEDIPGDLRRVSVGSKVPGYSNLGFAALGQALAVTSGQEYPSLIQSRLAEPLDLPALYVPVGGDTGLDPNAVQGRDAAGRAQQAWTDLGYAPAGGVRADAASMAILAEALLDGSAPGVAALEPTAEFDGDRIGAGWITSEIDGRTITWHNGGTGGFRSWFGLDRERGTAVFIAGATSTFLDEVGLALLHEASP